MSTVSDSESASPPPPTEVFRKDYTPLTFDVDSIRLEFDLNDGPTPSDKNTIVTSTLQLSSLSKPFPSVLELDCEEIEVQTVSVNGEAVGDSVLDGNKLRIPLVADWRQASQLTLTTVRISYFSAFRFKYIHRFQRSHPKQTHSLVACTSPPICSVHRFKHS